MFIYSLRKQWSINYLSEVNSSVYKIIFTDGAVSIRKRIYLVKFLDIKSECVQLCVCYIVIMRKIFVIVVMLRILLPFIQSSHWKKRDRSTGIFYNILMVNGLWSYEFLSRSLYDIMFIFKAFDILL